VDTVTLGWCGDQLRSHWLLKSGCRREHSHLVQQRIRCPMSLPLAPQTGEVTYVTSKASRRPGLPRYIGCGPDFAMPRCAKCAEAQHSGWRQLCLHVQPCMRDSRVADQSRCSAAEGFCLLACFECCYFVQPSGGQFLPIGLQAGSPLTCNEHHAVSVQLCGACHAMCNTMA
jgi:hypothetical protein